MRTRPLAIVVVVLVASAGCGRQLESNAPVLISQNDPQADRVRTAAKDSSGRLINMLGRSGTEVWAVPTKEIGGFSMRTNGLPPAAFEAVGLAAPEVVPAESVEFGALSDLQQQVVESLVGGLPAASYRITTARPVAAGGFVLGFHALASDGTSAFPVTSAQALSLRLVGDRRVTLRQTSIEKNSDSHFTWRGVIDGGGSATFTVMPDSMTGTVRLPDGVFDVSPVPGQIQVIHPASPARPDHPAPMPAPSGRGRGRGDLMVLGYPAPPPPPTPASAAPAANVCAVDQGEVVDVMFVYSPKIAATYAKNSSHAVSLINDVFINDKLPGRFNWVGEELFPGFTEQGFAKDIEVLRKNSWIKSRRDQIKADVVVAIVDEPWGNPLSEKPCGYAAIAPPLDVAAAVVEVGCLRSLTPAHEVGHLMGAAHEPPAPQPVPFSYGHGFVNAAKVFRTVMATDATCKKCERKPWWSNPATGAGLANVSEDWRIARDRAKILATARCR